MGVVIRTADEGDREPVTRLLDRAFRDDPVSVWVFPGAEDRRTRHPGLMAAFVDIVLAAGRIDVTEDGTACALWMSVPAEEAQKGPEGEQGGDDGPALVREAVDPDNERIELVGRLTGEIHPSGRAHEYLWLIAVAPERQGQGLGAALVQPVLDRCDREGVPAYLEASNPRSRALYERLGFAFSGRTVDLPDGPRMWPMWREPRNQG
ncbi:GNAT family N-acetyltransferase [Streptomyces phyllanthi]|uniref:N-acetyltransferase n=1 Tax=Streptomyces phyllanthi TaxID=1803180 RepID=A0A5N8W6R3_9ACTN|nr:GNAT family N-acetyltransferase [Streptomyces phyllanthi]MPY43177.1 N-acetyltransferase [Streptomyces phyllanthi]